MHSVVDMRLWSGLRASVLCVALLSALVCPMYAQEVHGAPDEFDYYLLNLSWAPEFCHNVEVLPASERFDSRRRDAAVECGTPHGFVLHGLWPQNFNGSWPAHCSDRPGPKSYKPYLKDTPSETLLQHEWSKHGTCTTLAPDAFFRMADHAFEVVRVPGQLKNVEHTLQMPSGDVLRAFYRANPSFPRGSVVLSCGRNYLTAINVCLEKSNLRPVACQNLHECGATVIKIAPERTGR